MKMLRCEMEVMDAIDDMLMTDEELMSEIETEVYEELESSNSFESDADYEDYIAECMRWDYISNENATVEDILRQYGYNYDDSKPSSSYNIRIRSDIIINADKVPNIHILRKFCSSIAIWVDRFQEPAKIIYTGKTFRVIINFE